MSSIWTRKLDGGGESMGTTKQEEFISPKITIASGLLKGLSAWIKGEQAKETEMVKGEAMLARVLGPIMLQEQGLIPFFPTPIPVDFHALRVMISTGVGEINPSAMN